MRELSIDRRYCGPPDSGNGGYVAGLGTALYEPFVAGHSRGG